MATNSPAVLPVKGVYRVMAEDSVCKDSEFQ